MNMTRRNLLACIAGAAIDPERLLWQPGKRVFSLPAQPKLLMNFTLFDPGQPQTKAMELCTGQSFDVIGHPEADGTVKLAKLIPTNQRRYWGRRGRGLYTARLDKDSEVSYVADVKPTLQGIPRGTYIARPVYELWNIGSLDSPLRFADFLCYGKRPEGWRA